MKYLGNYPRLVLTPSGVTHEAELEPYNNFTYIISNLYGRTSIEQPDLSNVVYPINIKVLKVIKDKVGLKTNIKSNCKKLNQKIFLTILYQTIYMYIVFCT